MYAFLMLHLNNRSESAWNIMNNGKLKPRENMLHCFALANVAMRTGRNDKAIEILQNRPVGNGYHPVYYLDYMLGLAKFYRGDGDADEHLKKYVYYFKGRNYIKEGFQRIAWFELLRNNPQGYKIFMENCKTAGRADIGGDKNALKEAQAGIAPDPILLRGRLFFDGGYYQKAYEHLKAKNESSFSSQANKLEYTYRMGRVLQMLKKPNEAIQFYDKTIQAGKQTKYYFACNAALQLGIIYEEYKQYDKARQYFNYCLALNPDDYSDSLHASAKAGLNRLKGKN
jgi:tetratricopeptide (TPR) repeat protein